MADAIATSGHAGHQVAKGLGVFSIVLGLAELVWPSGFTSFLGLPGLEWLVMAYGVREIVAGIGIFAATRRAGWLWFRVAGDALDIATVLYAFTFPNPPTTHIVIALVMLVGVTLVDLWCARVLTEQQKVARTSHAFDNRTGMPGPTG